MIPPEHFKISAHMMSQGHRLRLLQMGKARHVGIQVLIHDLQDGLQKLSHQSVRLFYFLPGVKLHVQGHLVIAAAPGVQLLARLADAFDQHRLHEAVNILIFLRDCKGSLLHVPENAFQAADDGLLLLPGQDPLLLQHGHVGNAARDILTVKSLVKRDGSVKRVDQLVRLLGKTPSP